MSSLSFTLGITEFRLIVNEWICQEMVTRPDYKDQHCNRVIITNLDNSLTHIVIWVTLGFDPF